MKDNCPNCGAIIEPYSCKCGYCGTWYYNLTMFDTLDDKPRYVKFRTEMNGKEVYLTALARPIMESAEMKSETTNVVYDNRGHEFKTVSKECDILVRFECYQDGTTGTLFQIQEGGKG